MHKNGKGIKSLFSALSGLLPAKPQTKNWQQNAQKLKDVFCAFCAFLWRKDFVLFGDFNFTRSICRILRSTVRRLSKAESKPDTTTGFMRKTKRA
jgi:hypothetical protein